MTTSMPRKKATNEPIIDPATQAPISTQPLVSKKTRTVTTIVSIVVVLVVLGILFGLGFLMYKSYDWAAEAGRVPGTVRLRDMSFIVIAVETLLLMIFALFIVVLLAILVVLIYDRVIPVLEQLNKAINTVVETTHTVRGTTTFVSEKMVTPFIEISGYAAGAARILKGIMDLFPKRSRPVNVKVDSPDSDGTPSES